eukprot:m.225893 g.225893  ORF g.225893 m.225893 type:complete len:785 (-) comp15963_c0_seq3:2189-4543(-)
MQHIRTVLLFLFAAFVSVQADSDPESCDGEFCRKEHNIYGRDANSNLLAHLPKDWRTHMTWGTFRPHIYAGVRSRTGPLFFFSDVMWSSHSERGTIVRHDCRQDDGLSYGWNRHDGSSFGTQDITDPKIGLLLQTLFTKEAGTWAISVNAKSTKEHSAKRTIMIAFGCASDKGVKVDACVRVNQDGTTATIADSILGIDSQISILGKPSAVWGEKDVTILTLKEAVKSALGEDGLLPNSVEDGSSIIVVQFEIGKEDIEVALVQSQNSELLDLSTLKKMSEKLSDSFDAEFQSKFGLEPSNVYLPLAREAFSALVGGLGYFYGANKVSLLDGTQTETEDGGLFSAVPCRPFFPRGFLWDEGFHQMVISQFNPTLTLDVLFHWFSRMQNDGWIPREQILGVEAEERVPSEFVRQHEKHANPPTLMLVIERLLDANLSTSDNELLHTLYPAAKKWMSWFISSQAGLGGTFHWHGRDPNDGKLHPMTLSSGLDDYPRASHPTKFERHVDLFCWVIKALEIMEKFGRAINDEAGANEYKSDREKKLQRLDKWHWDKTALVYSDVGNHSNSPRLKTYFVYRCRTPDGRGAVDVHMRQGEHPKCPPTHRGQGFPLGDGHGGHLSVQKISYKKKQKYQFVRNIGYISLFPLMLRLLNPESDQLLHTLQLMRNETHLWTDYGLRSLSTTNFFYDKENAPGDAPYWRGPIWININYLALYGLQHYRKLSGPHQSLAEQIFQELKENIVKNIGRVKSETNFFFEQYNDKTGKGQRNHPFTGWTSLVSLIIAEKF